MRYRAPHRLERRRCRSAVPEILPACPDWRRSAEKAGFGRERKKETLDDFFATQLGARQQRGIEAACVDMWKPYRLSIEQWAPNCRIRSHTG
jgi:hypothetical protein